MRLCNVAVVVFCFVSGLNHPKTGESVIEDVIIEFSTFSVDENRHKVLI